MQKIIKDVVIIGAGLTGLTTAYYLRKNGWDTIVLERDDRTGGSIRTFRRDGFVYESGPNTGSLSCPEVAELFDDLAPQCSIEVANRQSKRRMIYKNGKFRPLPSGLWQAVNTPLFRFRDKIRILGEPFRKRGNNPLETVGDMVIRRMGRSFLDYAVDPFIGGIYAGDPSKLVTRYALPKLWALEQKSGSFVKGAIRKKRQPVSERDKRATREVMSVVGGLQNLTDALSGKIGQEHILLEVSNISVRPSDEIPNGRWMVSAKVNGEFHQWYVRYVVSTVGTYALPPIFSFLGGKIIDSLTSMMYAKVVQVVLAFKTWKGMSLQSFGGLIPYKENRTILGILFISSFLQNRAPENGALMSVFIGGTRHPEYIKLSDQEITNMVLREVHELMHDPNLTPDFIDIFRHHYAIPQYEKSTKERLEAIEKVQQENPGLIIAGNLRDGIGMADRIRQGRTVADGIHMGTI